MSATTRALLVEAIGARRLVSFAYHGLPRVAEPHTYGVLGGKEQLLAYQVGGGSGSGGLPEWRRFDADGIEDARMLPGRFAPRSPAGHHAPWARVIAFVPSP